MNSDTRNQGSPGVASRFNWIKLLVIVAVAAAIATIITLWIITQYIFPTEL